MTQHFKTARLDANAILETLIRRLKADKEYFPYLGSSIMAVEMLCVLSGRKNYSLGMELIDHFENCKGRLDFKTADLVRTFLSEVNLLIDQH